MACPLTFSASKAALLLACPRPFVVAPFAESAPLTPAQQARAIAFREAGEYGTAFHRVMAARIMGQAAECISQEFHEHTEAALKCLRDWMASDPDWAPLSVIEAEIPYASRFAGDVLYSRITKFNQETHTYDLAPGEFGGTADLLLRGAAGQRIVLDIKTGRSGSWDEPSEVPQLRLLAAQLGAVGVAVLHTPIVGIPTVYSEYLAPYSDRGFAEAIRVRLSQVEHGEAPALEGPQCPRCPLFRECEGGARWRASKAKKAAKAAGVAGDD